MSAMTEKNRKKDKVTEVAQQEDLTDQGKDKILVKLEVYGEEMLEKVVKFSGNSGRVYLPPDWVGHRVKIIRI
jgi:putative transposon-encoded protein